MRVHHVRAGKDYPSDGIKKGEMHYTWSFYRQKPRRSLTRPSRSQLTQSDFLSQLYEAVDKTLPGCEDADAIRTLGEEMQQLADDERAKIDDLPENFQQAGPGEKLENRASELEAWAEELSSAAEDLGDETDFEAEEGGPETYADALRDKIEELSGSAPDPE